MKEFFTLSLWVYSFLENPFFLESSGAEASTGFDALTDSGKNFIKNGFVVQVTGILSSNGTTAPSLVDFTVTSSSTEEGDLLSSPDLYLYLLNRQLDLQLKSELWNCFIYLSAPRLKASKYV